MKNLKIIALIFAFLLFLSFMGIAEGKVVFLDLERVYNLGDEINPRAAITVNEDFEGFFRVNLVCDSSESLVYYAPLKINADSRKTVDIKLDSTVLGSCNLIGNLELDNEIQESESSNNFIITDIIQIEAELNKKHFIPGDFFEISGKVYKKNGDSVTGAGNIFVFDSNNSISLNKGSLSFSKNVPEGAKPGANNILIYVEDDFGNKGETNLEFTVASVSSMLVIETNSDQINPGESIEIIPRLVDQDNNTVPENVSLRLFKPESKLFILEDKKLLLEEFLMSGDSVSFKFDEVTEPGDYYIEAYSAGFKEQKVINIPEIEEIDVYIEAGILIVTNLGNVPYKKAIKLDLEFEGLNKQIILDLNVPVSGKEEFKLEAPKGTYDILVNVEDLAEKIKNFDNVPLVGNLVAAVELEQGSSKGSLVYLWVIIILVVIILIYLFRQRLKLKKLFKFNKKYIVKGPKEPSFSEKDEKKTVSIPLIKGNTSEKDFKPKKQEDMVVKLGKEQKGYQPAVASLTIDTEDPLKGLYEKQAAKQHSPVLVVSKLFGVQKKESAVLCIKFQGFMDLVNLKKRNTALFEKISNHLFEGVIKIIRQYGGVSILHHRKIFVIFPGTGQELNAIKTAGQIRTYVEHFDQQLRDMDSTVMLDIGAGVHTGLVSVMSEGRNFKFAFSDAISVAEALASKAFKSEILLSDACHIKVGSVVKAKRITPVYISGERAMEAFLVLDKGPSEMKEESKGRIRKILDKFDKF